MKIMNTFFQKPLSRKWTWQGPNASVKNEIDYVLAKRSGTVKDVKVITRVNIGSDHRLVTAKLQIDTKWERKNIIKKKKRVDRENLLQHATEFQIQLSNKFEGLAQDDDLDQQCTNLTNVINETALAVAGGSKHTKAQKLSQTTIDLMKKRREMKRAAPLQHIEYREVCKTLRKRIREECRKYNTKIIEDRLKEKSIKKMSPFS